MSDKNLTELEWKKFSKGRDLKDAALVKALAALEKAKAPDQQLTALAEIEKQADALRKSAKGDKEVGSYFDDLDKALDKQRKLSDFEAKKAAKQASSSESDEEETPALLTTKMVPLIRQVKKGEEMQALIANNGKEVAVMLSRRPIAPSKRKLMTEYLAGGTPKFIVGTCVFEENAYTFVLQTQAGGMAKKIRAALLKQVELRLKVRVRGDDPNDVDDDGEAVEDEGEGEAGSTDAGLQQPSTVPDAPPPPNPLKLQYEERWPPLEQRVLEALKEQTGDVSKIRAVAEFVREKGEGGNYKGALAGMDSLEKLLVSADTRIADDAPRLAADPEGAAFTARLTALMPKVKEAIALAVKESLDVKLKVSEAGVFARKKDFGQAHALLDEAETLMAAISANAKGESAGASPELQRYEKLLAALEPAYLDLLANRHPDASKLRTVMAYATEQAEAGEHAKASGAMDRLGKLIEAAQGAPTAPGDDQPAPGVVAYRKTLLALRQAVSSVDRQIAQLVSAIPGQLPDEVDLAEELAEELRESTEALNDLVDTAMSALGDRAAPATQALRDQLEDFIAEVRDSELIKHVDANPFGVRLSVEKTLGDALAAVREAMPALS